MMSTILEMTRINKSFSGVSVLRDVSFDLRAGEVHALMGENGAGKSTLMKILMGIYKADSGSILLQGAPVHFGGPQDALKCGIAMIHQELSPVLDMEVSENVFTGRELKRPGFERLGLVDRGAMRRETARLFREMAVDIDPAAPMRTLSVAQMQLVEIVKAISLSAAIIIMDEPTSAITDREVEVLFGQIAKLKQQGVSIIYISHKMDEIFRIADRITVLRDGQPAGAGEAAALDRETLIRMMVGREISEVFPKETVAPGKRLLEVKGLWQGRRVKDVSFELYGGEVLGIAGLIGAGRSELAETLFGMRHKTRGDVILSGKPVNIRHPKQAIAAGMALITEDRKGTGLNLKGTVAENITLVHLKRLSSLGVISRSRETAAAEAAMERLRVKARSGRAPVASLSGGNQQKVVLAKWLLAEPEIVILDEPTRGIDVGAKRDIYLLIGELAKAGKGVIVISSEMPEVMGISDRILVMCEGRVTGELKRSEFNQEAIMSLASVGGV